ncbi:MAG TPA: GNAT family N-acetyltransferase [Dehalococcoidia bacterium]|nr:GNAT family N-acetyltransferase [Dehalococcoidia bacterium]
MGECGRTLLSSTFTIRAYTPADLEAVQALDARVEPYRREDAAAVEAMFARAAEAPRPLDRWGHRHSVEFEAVLSQGYLAIWLATVAGHEVAGIVGVQRFHDGPEVGDLAPAIAWVGREDIAELVHLRVAPEARRQGIGEALVRRVLDWSRDEGFHMLVLNTTTPQFAARRLYERLGFREVGIAYLDAKYEVVWYAADLTSGLSPAGGDGAVLGRRKGPAGADGPRALWA